MKTLLAAALVLSAQSQDETSLMQGLARRVDGKLGADSSKRDTSKLMETATKMLKNGAGVTPDVLLFIENTITTIETNVLGAITQGHNTDQATLARIVAEMEAAIVVYESHVVTHTASVAQYDDAIREHHQCRSAESDTCGDSRECEVLLEELWIHVKREETTMREIHSRIHHSWCVDPLLPPHGDRTCFDQDACWHWNEEQAMEGPETSQTQLSYDNSFHYPIADYSSEVRNFRSVSVTTFEEYIAQKVIVEAAWDAYNAKIIECARLFELLEVATPACDLKQEEIGSENCALSQTDNTARRVFGEEWRRLHNEYDTETGCCTNDNGDECDIHAVHAHEIAPGATWEGRAIDLTCSCTGIRQMEFDRMREWETLHIVTCLLNTVHTHVIHSIETNEPCPTIETHQEQTESEINTCHNIELSLSANLTIDYCGDTLPLECPAPPNPPTPEDPKCTAQYNWDTIGHLGESIPSHESNEAVHIRLSDAGWGTCAAPKACAKCEGHGPVIPDSNLVEPSSPCMWHQQHLGLGENDEDTFRCLSDSALGSHCSDLTLARCVPMASRCNGVSNCHDGSDEVGCDTAWELPQWLGESYACPVVGTPGQQDDVHFFCLDGGCTSVSARCNGHNNCADDSDEGNCPTTADGVTVETSTGLQATLETVTNGAHVFHDREYTFKSIGSFTGIKMVKYSNEDKFIAHDRVQMKLRLQQPMTVYIVTTQGQVLPWLDLEGWTEVPALTGLEYSGVRMTPDKDWSGSLDAIDREEQHYGPGHVFEKTFPAGVVHLRGNGGGAGYDWTPNVEGGYGSYLTFVAHPSHPASPHLPVEHDSRLTAYWDAGGCGVHGNDYNADWCGGVVNGNHPASHCQEFVTVSSSICASEVATLTSYEGDGTCCNSVTINSCNYAYFAQYRCAEDHEVPVVILPIVYDSRLAAYWDHGVCGPQGEDSNWDWCNRDAGHPASECATSVEVSTDICATGHASLESTQGTGDCCSSVNIDGCNYAYYAQYVCSDAPGPIVLPLPVVHDSRLTAYWDAGACGPHGDDHNWGWCGQADGNCPESVTVDSSLCASNTARLETMSGTGQCCSSVVLDGCNYAYHAQYVCADPASTAPVVATSHTSFRLTVTSNYASTTHFQISELNLYNQDSEVDLSGTVTSPTGTVEGSHAIDCRSSEGPEFATDSNTGTKWCVHELTVADGVINPNVVLSIQLPQATTVTGLSFTTGNDVNTRDPRRFILEGSNGNNQWDMIVDHSCSDATRVTARRTRTPVFTTVSAGCLPL